MNTTEFLQARLAATQAQILLYETASEQLATGEIQSYTIDTGQTRQVVTRLNLTELQNAIDRLYNRCVIIEARLTGNNVSVARPGF